jgi:hypothetical protein
MPADSDIYRNIRYFEACFYAPTPLFMPKLLRLVLVMACLAGLSIYATAQPVINHFSPVSGPAGSSVVITGAGFSPSATGNIVFMGAARAVVTAASASSLTVTIPSGATFQPITGKPTVNPLLI